MIAGQLEIQLMANMARLQADMDMAKRAVGGAMEHIDRTVGAAKTALMGLGAGLSVAAFSQWMRGAIDAGDETNKLAQKIGVATKEVAGMQLAFRQAGVGDAFATSMAKMSKSVAEGSKAFQAMGISTRETDGTLRSNRVLLGEVADKFAGYAAGAAKSALAQEIFGKSGAELIPLLNAGAQGLAEYDAMAAKLGLTIGEETAKQAEKFNDTLDLIGQGSQGVARQIAAQLLPTLSGLADQFFTSMSSGDKLKNTATFLANSMKLLYIAGLGVVEVFSTVGKVLGGVGAAVVAALSGDFSGASGILKEMKSDIGAGWKDTLKQVEGAWNATGSAAVESMATTQRAVKGAAPLLADLANQTKAAAEAQKEAAKAQKLLNDLNLEAMGFKDDFAVKWIALSKLEDGTKGLTAAQKELLSQQPKMKDAAKAEADSLKELTKLQDTYADAQLKNVASSFDEVNKAQAAYDAHGKLASVIMEETVAREENWRISMVMGGEDTAAIDVQIANHKRLITILKSGEVRDASEKTAKDAADAWADASKQIGQSLTDQIMDGGRNAADYVSNLFRTLVLRPVISAFTNPVGQAASTAMFGTAANAATGASATSGLMGASGLATSGTLFSAGMQSTMANGMISGFGTNMANIGMNLQAGAYSQAMGTALPYVGAIIAGYTVLKNLGVFGSNFISATDSGRARVDYTAAGIGGAAYSTTGDASQIATQTKAVESLAQTYFKTAAALGIQAMQATFEVGSNTGREGANPNTVLGVNIGSAGYSSGEIASGDTAAIQLAASRAIFTALQASELPGYLSKVFDDITASSATQAQIDGALQYAGALKQVREALLETRTPLEVLQANVDSAFATLGTSADTFKRDFVSAIDAGISPESLSAWQALGGGLDTLAANAKATADALKATNQGWQDKLDVLTGAQTDRTLALRNATDASTRALMRQVYAQEDIKAATDAATAAQTAATEAAKAAAQTRLETANTGASDAMAAVQRAVAAQRQIYQAQVDTAQEAVSDITSIYNTLDGALSTLRGQSDIAYSTGVAFINNAVSNAQATGYMPESKALASAVQSALNDPTVYASQADANFARLQLAGSLSQLKDISGTQLTTSDQALKIAKDQLNGLDGILNLAQKQLDAANGIDTSVRSVAEAMATLSATLGTLVGVRTAQGLPTAKPTASTGDITTVGNGAQAAVNTAKYNVVTDMGGWGKITQAVTDADQIARFDSIRAYIETLDFGSGGVDASVQALADAAHTYGVSISELATASGYPYKDVQALFTARGIPSFRVGTNYIQADGPAYLHEGEAVVPKAYNPAAGGSSNTRLETLVAGLTSEVQRLQGLVAAGNANTSRTASAVEGNQSRPILVEVAT